MRVSGSTTGAKPAKPAAAKRDTLKRQDDSADAIQHVVDGIVYGIRSGQLAPGQHLVESDLTRRFGVSRGSLREGLKRLAAMGVIQLTRFRGAFIAALDRKGIGELLDVLEPLCVLAARLAAQNCRSEAERGALRSIAEELSRDGDGGGRAAYLENRRRFYDHLIKMGGNAELMQVIPLARTDLFRAQFDTVQTREHRTLHSSGYGKIAEAVGKGDAAKAERAVRKHFASTRKTLQELPDHGFAVNHETKS